MEERTCAGCPAVLVKGPRERNPRKWCSGTCRQRWLRVNRPTEMRAISLRSAERRKTELAAARTDCLNCGVRLRKAGATYCIARECQKVKAALRERERYAADPAAKRTAVAAARAARTPEQLAQSKLTRRAWKEAGGRDALRSADSRRRARKFAAPVESFTHLEIFERDGWRCGICRQRINRRLSYPNPRSASLDHIIPLALGGSHTRANVRATHLDCNVQRGAARAGSDQLALI